MVSVARNNVEMANISMKYSAQMGFHTAVQFVEKTYSGEYWMSSFRPVSCEFYT